MSSPQTFADLRARFQPREKSVTFVTGGHLLAEHDAATQELATAMAQTRTSLADGGSVQGLAERVADLETRIADTTVTIRVRGLARNAFRRLLDAHQTDDDDPFDKVTFPPALIAACAVDPPMTEADTATLGEILTDGQFDELFGAAWAACRDVDDVPFSTLASAVNRA